MRLGGSMYQPRNVAELEAVVPAFDAYGLSAVTATGGWAQMTDDDAAAYGEAATRLGMVIGEAHHRPNLMIQDADERASRIQVLRTGLAKAEIMGCRAVTILVGTVASSDHLAEPHPYMYTEECRKELREILLRALDGLYLDRTKLVIEPWTNSFFYQPGPIREFLDDVGHPSVGLHLDQMNMMDQSHYYDSTSLINETFDLLTPYIGGVHFKDLRWDWQHMFLKFDEVLIGDGVLDYRTYLDRVSHLDPDITCFCEHLPDEGSYAINFARLHKLAAELGTSFQRRSCPA